MIEAGNRFGMDPGANADVNFDVGGGDVAMDIDNLAPLGGSVMGTPAGRGRKRVNGLFVLSVLVFDTESSLICLSRDMQIQTRVRGPLM